MLLALGSYTEAQQVLQTALETDPNHIPALFAAAQLLLASAKFCTVQGTPGDTHLGSCCVTLVEVSLCRDLHLYAQLKDCGKAAVKQVNTLAGALAVTRATLDRM